MAKQIWYAIGVYQRMEIHIIMMTITQDIQAPRDFIARARRKQRHLQHTHHWSFEILLQRGKHETWTNHRRSTIDCKTKTNKTTNHWERKTRIGKETKEGSKNKGNPRGGKKRATSTTTKSGSISDVGDGIGSDGCVHVHEEKITTNWCLSHVNIL